MSAGVVLMLGARMNYSVPRILSNARMLNALYTDSYIGNKPVLKSTLRLLSKCSTSSFIKQWLGRECVDVDPRLVRSFEVFGIRYALERRRCSSVVELEQVYVDFARKFCELIPPRSIDDADFIWAYNAGSAYYFERVYGKVSNILLEQTILPKRLELSLLRKVLLDFSSENISKSPYELDYSPIEALENVEWKCANSIFVGSEFVRDGLIECGVEDIKIHVVPYGVHLPANFEALDGDSMQFVQNRKLRLLFVGEVGIRKGAPYLLEALALLPKNKVECRFVGRNTLSDTFLDKFSDVAEFVGVVPRSEVSAHYSWADVFILPSIVEGSATASYEAISHCLPSIVTPNVGSRVIDGCSGLIVNAFDVGALVSAIQLYCDNPDVLAEHKEGAKQLRDSISYQRYSENLLHSLRSFCDIQPRFTQ
jgi:glycosyltransferase involved in cell wall biosynthesis